MQENIKELTDEYIIGDMLHSARVFLIIGIVILIMVIVVFAFKKKINMPFSRIAFLFIFGILLAVGSIFIGVRTLLGLKDFTVIETVVTDKKCVEEYDPTGTKKMVRKKQPTSIMFISKMAFHRILPGADMPQRILGIMCI